MNTHAPADPSVRRGFIGFMTNVLTSGTYLRLDIGLRSRIIFVNAVMIVAFFVLGSFSILALRSGNIPLGVATAVALVLVIVTFLVMRRTRRVVLAGYLCMFIILALYMYLTFTGGESGSGVLWAFSFPLVSLFLTGVIAGTAWAAVLWIFMGIMLFVPGLNPSGFETLYSIRVMGVYFFIWLFALTYELVRRSTLKAFETANINLAATAEDLNAQKKHTDNILRHVREGIFLLDANGKIGPSYSAYLAEILGQEELAGSSLYELLAPCLEEAEGRALADYLSLIFKEALREELIREINPLEHVRVVFNDADGSIKEKWLCFSFSRISGGSSGGLVLGVVQDVTEETRMQEELRNETEQHRKEMEKLFRIVHLSPGVMEEFIQETEAELNKINNLLRDGEGRTDIVIPEMYQVVHGIKGNTLLLGLDQFAQVVHSIEDKIRPFLEKPCSWKDLLSLTLGLAAIRQEVEGIRDLIVKILSFQGSHTQDGIGLLERSLNELSEKLCMAEGKKVQLDISGHESIELPLVHRRRIKDILIQLVHNAIIHGIEAPEERKRLGKPEMGRLTIDLASREAVPAREDRSDGKADFDKGPNPQNSEAYSAEKNLRGIVVSVKDDGRGLDLDAVKSAAVQLGLSDKDSLDTMPPAKVARFIFAHGLSTRDTPGLHAGRGVGMALVKRLVDEAGGKMSLRFANGRYCECVIHLPVT